MDQLINFWDLSQIITTVLAVEVGFLLGVYIADRQTKTELNTSYAKGRRDAYQEQINQLTDLLS